MDSSHEISMLRAVRFQGFKSLRDVELAGLQQLNVVVGPSGVGKTSVLQGLEFLAWLVGTARQPFKGSSAKRLMTLGEIRLAISCSTTTEATLDSEVTLGPGESELQVRFEAAQGERRDAKSIELGELDSLAGWGAHLLEPAWLENFGQLRSALFLKLDVERLGAISLSSSEPSIEHDGRGLATVLAYFAGAYRDRLQSLETELRAVTGMTGQIRTFPADLEIEENEVIRIDEQFVSRRTKRMRAAHRFEVEIDGLGSVPGDLLSEGTLTTLGLLALLHQPQCPRLLLLDDIDQGLHPDAQAKLVAVLRRLLASRPDTQIVCTSHSPYLLDHFRAEEVQVLAIVDGQVSAARLDHHQDWPRWEGKLQTGEFWQTVGENWVGDQPHEAASG